MSNYYDDVTQRLEPLLARLRAYDSSRNQLEKFGGAIEDLKIITAILTGKFVLEGSFMEHAVSLSDPEGISSALFNTGVYGLHFDVRVLPNGMPVFYLCRRRNDFWAEYSLVVEDLYTSPGYRFPDERFVKLMEFGHETYFLRLSQFRQRIIEYLPVLKTEGSVDEMLNNLGRHVFQAAWHEDQSPGYSCSFHFGMPSFRHAIELLYLCLSGELCELRSAADSRMLRFFEVVYPQPAIRNFLNLLQDLDGSALNAIPKRALGYCGTLSKAFRQFLSIEIPWGHRRTNVPMHKLVFGNFSRLHLVSTELGEEAAVRAAANRLDQASQSIIEQLTEQEHV